MQTAAFHSHTHPVLCPGIRCSGAEHEIRPGKRGMSDGGKLRIRPHRTPVQTRKRPQLRLHLARQRRRPEKTVPLQAGKTAGRMLPACAQTGWLLQTGKAAGERMRMQAKAVLAVLARRRAPAQAAGLLSAMRLLRQARISGAVRPLLRVRMDRNSGRMPVRMPRAVLLR